MKTLMMMCAAAIAFGVTAVNAATIDLAGVDATASDLSSETVYTNTSETPASLVFDCSDAVAFAGTIQGNIAVVKQGAGELALTGANTYSGGTYVSNGWLKVSADIQVAGGAVRLGGGNLRIGANYTPSSACFTLDANSTVDTGAFQFGIKPATFVTKGRTMTKTGGGRISMSGTFSDTQVKGSTWILEEGFLSVFQNPFEAEIDMTLELHEGTYILSTGHVPIPSRLVLRGGELRGSANKFTSAVVTGKWKNFSLNNTITVLPSLDGRPSVVNALAVHMGNGTPSLVPTFDVREGAELQMNTALAQGRTGDADSAPLMAGSFVKKGAGTLVVMQPGTLKGLVRLEEGTLRFGKGGGLGKDATLVARAGTKVSLDDGAVIDCNYCGNSLMSSAEVWIDATKFSAADSATVSTIPNLGTCGGSFGQFNGRTISGTIQKAAAPTYKADAINGHPAFSFNGHQALALDTYTNTTSQFTIFVAARCTYWGGDGNKGKWAGVLAGHSTDDSATDNNSNGAFYNQDNGSYIQWFVGNKTAITLSSHSQIIAGMPFIDCIRRDGTSANVMQYLYGSDTPGSQSTTGLSSALNVNRLGLCCRLGTNACCEYSGDNNYQSRLWYGDVGEVLVFSRSLSDSERAAVNEYLREKWHNTTNSEVSVDALYSGRRDTIDVSAGVASLVTARTEEGALTKTGAGTLRVNAMSNRQDVRVAEGTIDLLPTSVVAHIDVWMDAADESVVATNADGRIATLRNKGNAGGVFAASPSPKSATYGAPTPVWESGAINGLRGLKFAGDSALVLDSYVNTNKHGFLTVFMVAERSPDIQFGVAGRGKWSAPFSMASTASSDSDDVQSGAFHYDEKADGENATPYDQFYTPYAKAESITNSVPNGAAFILTCYLEGNNQYYNFETYASESAKKVTQTGWRSCNFNRLQLGCRLDGYGRTPLYGVGDSATRGWYGRIGEFIACTAPLSDAEKSEITGYLRKKWMNKGDGSASAPSVLTGAALAGSLGADTALTLAQGAAVSSGAATQPISSFTAEGAATLARSVVTDAADYALFSVSGDVTLPSAMTFRGDSLPSDDADILTFGGYLNTTDTDWTVISTRRSAYIHYADGRIRLCPKAGLIFVVF